MRCLALEDSILCVRDKHSVSRNPFGFMPSLEVASVSRSAYRNLPILSWRLTAVAVKDVVS